MTTDAPEEAHAWSRTRNGSFAGWSGGLSIATDNEPTERAQQYEAAHAAHYARNDLRKALELYKGIMAAHPSTREAECSRSQIKNIVRTAVPGFSTRYLEIRGGGGQEHANRQAKSASLLGTAPETHESDYPMERRQEQSLR